VLSIEHLCVHTYAIVNAIVRCILTVFQQIKSKRSVLKMFIKCSAFHRTELTVFLFAEFVPVIEQLFNEMVLIGSGWTTHDSLR
jgi:hypothetical protein